MCVCISVCVCVCVCLCVLEAEGDEKVLGQLESLLDRLEDQLKKVDACESVFYMIYLIWALV